MGITFFVSGTSAEEKLLSNEAATLLRHVGYEIGPHLIAGQIGPEIVTSMAYSALNAEAMEKAHLNPERMARKAVGLAEVAGAAKALNKSVTFG